MRNLPKILKTKQDILNCYHLVKDKGYDAKGFFKLLTGIRNRNYLITPIDELSEDRKTVTIAYCNEAVVGGIVSSNEQDISILSVEHIDGDTEDEMSGTIPKVKTIITLESPMKENAQTLFLQNTPTVYEEYGIDRQEFWDIYTDIRAMVKGS